MPKLPPGALAGLTGATTNAAAQFLLVMLITRTLPPATAGTFFTATASALMLTAILRLDTGNGLIYFRARQPEPPPTPDPLKVVLPSQERNEGGGAEPRGGTKGGWVGEKRNSWVLLVALGPVVGVSVLVGGGVVWVSPGSWGLAGVLPVVVVADVLVAATRGRGVMRPTLVLAGVVQPVGQLVLVGGALLAGASVPVLLFAWALPALPVLVLAGVRVSSDSFGRVSWAEFWRYTAPRSVAAGIQAVFQRLDIVVVALLAGPAEAAMYTAATRFKVVGQRVSQGLAQAVQPQLIRAIADNDPGKAKRLYRQATRTLMTLTWPIWIGYAVLAPWILRLFGPSYPQGVDIALVLSATMMIATACGMVDVVLIASGRTTASLVNVISAVAVTITLDLLLVPTLGALGAALGWSGGVLVKNFLPLVQLYGLRPRIAT